VPIVVERQALLAHEAADSIAPSFSAAPLLPGLVDDANDKPPARKLRQLASVGLPQNASNLADEVALLDRAKAAAATHNPKRTLQLLNGYQRQFPKGALGPEAKLLRLEALVQSGRSTEASPLARQLLMAAPKGPHAERIRALVPNANSEFAESNSRSNETSPPTSE
jgi:hypothetical protein